MAERQNKKHGAGTAPELLVQMQINRSNGGSKEANACSLGTDERPRRARAATGR